MLRSLLLLRLCFFHGATGHRLQKTTKNEQVSAAAHGVFENVNASVAAQSGPGTTKKGHEEGWLG
eukprot:CAMPEP_0171786792 /NCGR_PEP_ID=MMETSP0991-20121206/63523_1 /TAXON_ID=483369 /ORGANISM="non described non described, Strain CCMP2098" /LENGTH=64 /DNA_ID=CAMNT_0012395635 /DNA_START=77 /DNA_END=267 /DNA_ORIENTATION=+